MQFLKKLFLVLLALALLLSGLWLVVANDQRVMLDLLFLQTRPGNLGLVVLVAFAAGCGIGLLVGLNLLELLRLRNRLFWLKREVRQLQDALGDRR
ncbi:MAG TPA: lipopolysaccharide assembly protein LapA domain-containing protein [Moraxellaceae bacterium]|nr:lipopolysaccharide assembly protein LapA domain-containing protein [Moraxellaceae bacterium]